jgi:GT2 family glycosyltransferase
MKEPWLSVILPTYNGAAFLPKALESVRAQGDAGLELIAVDDGSTDATIEILDEYATGLPLRIERRPRSGNWVAGTNHGLSLAHGKYVCFLHQDDVWAENRVSVLRAAVETAPDAALVVHPSWFVDSTGRKLGLWRCPLPEGKLDGQLVMERLIIQNFLAIPAPIFRRELVLQNGGMDESLWYTADWDLWLALARIGPVVHVPRPLASFRVHTSSQTSQRTGDESAMREQLEAVLRKHLPAAARRHENIAAAATLSAELNVALAAALHGSRFPWARLLRRFVSLGPLGWHRFWRDSRIGDRVSARLRNRSRAAHA